MQAIAFPLRLRDNGLLRRQDVEASVINLIQVMARTPAGSWQGCSNFGLRDLFEGGRRPDIPEQIADRVNEVFQDLGLSGFSVTEVVREISPQRDMDTFAIVISRNASNEIFTATVQREY